jgi:hypothetical protein
MHCKDIEIKRKNSKEKEKRNSQYIEKSKFNRKLF